MKTKQKIFKKIHVYQISRFSKKIAISQVFVFAGDLIKNYNTTNKKKAYTKDKSFVSFP